VLQTLAEVTLKSGEAMSVVKATAPEPDWIDRILPFLAHKGDHWLVPMRQAYEAGLDDLVMSDFLGVLDDGQVVGNITTVESDGIAILQHVFTPPEHRRKGICNHLMAALCEDFRSRTARAVHLGTGYDTPPFHIYEGFGFRGRGDSGKMTWIVDPAFPDSYFVPGETTVAETRWEDWPKLEALYALTGHWQLKSHHFQQFGHACFESAYPALRRDMESGSIICTRVMRTETGAVVGHAMLGPDLGWRSRALALDFMVHPGFVPQAHELLDAIALPNGSKVHAYCDERATDKAELLEGMGFEREATLSKLIEDENHVLMDVLVYGNTA